MVASQGELMWNSTRWPSVSISAGPLCHGRLPTKFHSREFSVDPFGVKLGHLEVAEVKFWVVEVLRGLSGFFRRGEQVRRLELSGFHQAW